jgi:hypothetical protein
MIFAASLLALSLSPSAAADTLTIQKSGPFAVYAWVDGQPAGRIKGKKLLYIDVPAGEHEVWIATEDTGTVTSCHGLITVQGNALVAARSQSCDGLADGFPATGGFFRGTMASMAMDTTNDTWLTVNGGPALVLPAIPLELNLAPGAHSLVLYSDEALSTVLAEGAVELGAGQRISIACTDAGCEGWDTTAPAIEASVPAP